MHMEKWRLYDHTLTPRGVRSESNECCKAAQTIVVAKEVVWPLGTYSIIHIHMNPRAAGKEPQCSSGREPVTVAPYVLISNRTKSKCTHLQWP